MLSVIDWTRPWYHSVQPAAQLLALDTLGLIGALNAAAASLALTNHAGQPIRFVPQADLPAGRAYEQFIGATGCVPTRENLHDFFNGLVWLSFPRTKQQLNALQAAQIALSGVGKSRGPARDGATIFDENCAVLVVKADQEGAALVAALRAHGWSEALFVRRAQFAAEAQVWLFGHALMEKLVAPRKAITAHTRVITANDAYFNWPHEVQRDWIDQQMAASLARDGVSTADFTPLPVLGVPGWWEEQDGAFYADATVFRAKRAARAAV